MTMKSKFAIALQVIVFHLIGTASLAVSAEAGKEGMHPDAVRPASNPACYPPTPRIRLEPQDYRNADAHWRETVERPHFQPHYAAYLAGHFYVPAGRARGEAVSDGFDYTLWGFPNHPLALAAIEQLSFRQNKALRLERMLLPVECYFQRAIEWYPDDAFPHAVYGYYLARRGRKAEALYVLGVAESGGLDSLDANLYLAFAYIELRDYEKAASHARSVYGMGYPLPGLRQRLAREGVLID